MTPKITAVTVVKLTKRNNFEQLHSKCSALKQNYLNKELPGFNIVKKGNDFLVKFARSANSPVFEILL